MNKRNLEFLNKLIREKGNQIQDTLPILQVGVPRQAQAHLYKAIKDSFGIPLKEISDSRYEEVLEVIKLCVEHASDPNVEAIHLSWVQREPEPATLNNFFE